MANAFELWLLANQCEPAAGYAGEINPDGSHKRIRKMLRAEEVLAKYYELNGIKRMSDDAIEEEHANRFFQEKPVKQDNKAFCDALDRGEIDG